MNRTGNRTGNRTPRQLAALVCCMVTGYLTIATTCLRGDGGIRKVSATVELPKGATAQRYRLTVIGGDGLSMVTDPPLLFRADPASILPESTISPQPTVPILSMQADAGTAPDAALPPVPPEPGTPSLEATGFWVPDCSRLDCNDLHFAVERMDSTEALSVQLEISVTLGLNCDGKLPELIEVELTEDP